MRSLAMTTVAITGGVGTGKSTVLRCLQEMGAATASADSIAKSVFESCEVQAALKALLSIRSSDDELVDPTTVRAAIAADPPVRRAVNALTHSKILNRLFATEAQFFEVPLLLETCLQGRFGETWVVACDPEIQLGRVMSRGILESEARLLIASQLHLEVKTAFADCIVRTNEPEQRVKEYVRNVARRIIGGGLRES